MGPKSSLPALEPPGGREGTKRTEEIWDWRLNVGLTGLLKIARNETLFINENGQKSNGTGSSTGQKGKRWCSKVSDK